MDIKSEVKAVIWDLDDTFWSGTLSEGKVLPDDLNIKRVKLLNQRGIVNSICSKNDFLQVRSILEKLGLWDQFVFPSIQWAPKGQQVRQIIADMKLRTENVLFVDNDEINRREVSFYNADIQIMDPLQWSTIDCSNWGKNDTELSRLKSYKLLETKARQTKLFTGSNEEFLRNSGIVVTLTPFSPASDDVDRIVELINRSHQLNYTKRRFTHGPAQLLFSLSDKQSLAFNVHVSDNFGDYGICGFISISKTHQLDDFLFSCRLLDMGVERAVYQQLSTKFEKLQVSFDGNALLNNPADWVSIRFASAAQVRNTTSENSPLVLAVMGCLGHAIAPFLEPDFRVTCTTWLTAARGITYQYKDVLAGKYDFVIIHAQNEALFPIVQFPFVRIPIPIMLNAAVLRSFPMLQKKLESSLRSREEFDLFGRTIAGGSLAIRFYYWLTKRWIFFRQTQTIDRVRVLRDLERLRKAVPQHTKIIFVLWAEDAEMFSEGLWTLLKEKAHKQLNAANEAATDVASKYSNFILFDMYSTIENAEKVGGYFGHFSHKTNYEIGCQLKRFLKDIRF